MSLPELQRALGGEEVDEGYASLLLTAMERTDESLSLRLHVDFNPYGEGLQTSDWAIECRRPRAYVFRNDPTEWIEASTEHPLLLMYQSPRASISFVGKPTDANALVVALEEAREELLGEWADELTLAKPPRPAFYNVGYGTVAHGPLPIARAYAALYERFGLSINLIEGQGEPVEWREHPEGGGSYEPYPPLEVLVFGASYVVAEGFEVRRLSG